MPHIVVEYSANLDTRLDVMRLLGALHQAALHSGMIEPGGLRTRAERRSHCIVADGAPENAFVAIRVRVGAGRDVATRSRFADALFAAATDLLEPLYRSGPLAISLDVEQIDPVTSRKRNNLHARLRAGAAAED
jgi:5-carboxymethyl-2-hydroxymuconate isomerase